MQHRLDTWNSLKSCVSPFLIKSSMKKAHIDEIVNGHGKTRAINGKFITLPFVICNNLQDILAVYIIFPKGRNTFQYPISKRVYKRLSRRVVAFIIELYIASEEGLVTAWSAALRSLTRRAEITPSRSVGDIKSFQNSFAFIISKETCFSLKRVSDRTFFSAFQKGVSNPL